MPGSAIRIDLRSPNHLEGTFWRGLNSRLTTLTTVRMYIKMKMRGLWSDLLSPRGLLWTRLPGRLRLRADRILSLAVRGRKLLANDELDWTKDKMWNRKRHNSGSFVAAPTQSDRRFSEILSAPRDRMGPIVSQKNAIRQKRDTILALFPRNRDLQWSVLSCRQDQRVNNCRRPGPKGRCNLLAIHHLTFVRRFGICRNRLLELLANSNFEFRSCLRYWELS